MSTTANYGYIYAGYILSSTSTHMLRVGFVTMDLVDRGPRIESNERNDAIRTLPRPHHLTGAGIGSLYVDTGESGETYDIEVSSQLADSMS